MNDVFHQKDEAGFGVLAPVDAWLDLICLHLGDILRHGNRSFIA